MGYICQVSLIDPQPAMKGCSQPGLHQRVVVRIKLRIGEQYSSGSPLGRKTGVGICYESNF